MSAYTIKGSGEAEAENLKRPPVPTFMPSAPGVNGGGAPSIFMPGPAPVEPKEEDVAAAAETGRAAAGVDASAGGDSSEGGRGSPGPGQAGSRGRGGAARAQVGFPPPRAMPEMKAPRAPPRTTLQERPEATPPIPAGRTRRRRNSHRMPLLTSPLPYQPCQSSLGWWLALHRSLPLQRAVRSAWPGPYLITSPRPTSPPSPTALPCKATWLSS